MTKTDSTYRVVTCQNNPDLVWSAQERIGAERPEFMLHNPVANGFDDCYEKLPQYQFVLIDDQSGEAVGIGNSIPLAYDGDLADLPDDGWAWAMTQGLDDLANGRKPAACTLSPTSGCITGRIRLGAPPVSSGNQMIYHRYRR